MSFKEMFYLLIAWPLSLSIVLTTGCASNPPPTDLTKYYRATVYAGSSDVGQERLIKYNARLKQIAGFSNLEADWIGCINCTEVENGTRFPELIYVFYREHKRSLKLLVRAWNDVHNGSNTQGEINDFTILYDSKPLDAMACPASPPAPSGCTNVPSCQSTDRCDRYFPTPTPCQKCAF